jgi:hypothetical protein
LQLVHAAVAALLQRLHAALLQLLQLCCKLSESPETASLLQTTSLNLLDNKKS